MNKVSLILFSGVLLAASLSTPAMAEVTITFDEAPMGTLANGLMIDIVTFSSADISTTIGNGPGITNFTSDPGMEGDTTFSLNFSFATAVSNLTYGFTLSSPLELLTDASSIEVFDLGGSSLGVFSSGTAFGTFGHPSGQINISGVGSISSAIVSFDSNSADRYLFDNLTYNTVPAPGALVLLGLGGLVGARRRR